jgi:hypothetical protein
LKYRVSLRGRDPAVTGGGTGVTSTIFSTILVSTLVMICGVGTAAGEQDASTRETTMRQTAVANKARFIVYSSLE